MRSYLLLSSTIIPDCFRDISVLHLALSAAAEPPRHYLPECSKIYKMMIVAILASQCSKKISRLSLILHRHSPKCVISSLKYTMAAVAAAMQSLMATNVAEKPFSVQVDTRVRLPVAECVIFRGRRMYRTDTRKDYARFAKAKHRQVRKALRFSRLFDVGYVT